MDDNRPRRSAIVSGGSSGIGLAIAARLRERGDRVAVADIMPPPAELGCDFTPTDVRRQTDVDAFFSACQPLLPTLSTLVCCAGRGVHERLDQGDPRGWSEIFELNVMGALRLIRAFVPQLVERRGDVVIIGSVAAQRQHPWSGVYNASKAALESLAETLRLEMQPEVRVAVISPGVVDTGFFAAMLGAGSDVDSIGYGALEAGDVADAALYALDRPPHAAMNHLTLRPRAQPL
ncbi:MAG TPA: SDR family oxidoreductase [Rhodanobacteraceae bacterium]|nr:SDR family oxidoreductase [Rhodanobacteraceae bacterium]